MVRTPTAHELLQQLGLLRIEFVGGEYALGMELVQLLDRRGDFLGRRPIPLPPPAPPSPATPPPPAALPPAPPPGPPPGACPPCPASPCVNDCAICWPDRDAGAEPHRIAGDAAGAAVLRHLGNGLAGLVLDELAHVVADHAHADPLVEDLLQFLGKRDALDREALEQQPERFDGRRAARAAAAWRIRPGSPPGRGTGCRPGDGVGDVLQDQSAQLAVQVVDAIAVARAGDLAVEFLRIADRGRRSCRTRAAAPRRNPCRGS